MTFYGNQHTGGQYTYEEIVEATKALGEELGRPPTTREAVDDDRFPSLQTIYRYADDGWLGVLEDAGLEQTQVREYGKQEELRMRRDLRGAFATVDTDYLTHRQYDDLGEYPTSVVKEQFGSWQSACETAGVPIGQKHGTVCEGPKGNRLESRHEKRVAAALFEHEIAYTVHPSVPDSDWAADFYLPEHDLWVEVNGYGADSRPNQQGFQKKVEHLRTLGEDVCIVETPAELLNAVR